MAHGLEDGPSAVVRLERLADAHTGFDHEVYQLEPVHDTVAPSLLSLYAHSLSRLFVRTHLAVVDRDIGVGGRDRLSAKRVDVFCACTGRCVYNALPYAASPLSPPCFSERPYLPNRSADAQ